MILLWLLHTHRTAANADKSVAASAVKAWYLPVYAMNRHLSILTGIWPFSSWLIALDTLDYQAHDHPDQWAMWSICRVRWTAAILAWTAIAKKTVVSSLCCSQRFEVSQKNVAFIRWWINQLMPRAWFLHELKVGCVWYFGNRPNDS
jgi:hypothetical protein